MTSLCRQAKGCLGTLMDGWVKSTMLKEKRQKEGIDKMGQTENQAKCL